MSLVKDTNKLCSDIDYMQNIINSIETKINRDLGKSLPINNLRDIANTLAQNSFGKYGIGDVLNDTQIVAVTDSNGQIQHYKILK